MLPKLKAILAAALVSAAVAAGPGAADALAGDINQRHVVVTPAVSLRALLLFALEPVLDLLDLRPPERWKAAVLFAQRVLRQQPSRYELVGRVLVNPAQRPLRSESDRNTARH
jgi:hypothetical protein